jgi:hypothetical protein
VYLGIDFLIGPGLEPCLIEVNVGLPGGAHEYDFTCRVHDGRPSDVFRQIEDIARETRGTSFAGYLGSLPWLGSLKEFKLWMDGQGPLPGSVPPALRLEDKWVQYQILSSRVRIPETIVFEPGGLPAAERFLARKGRLVAKRRLGRGGRDFRPVDGPGDLPEDAPGPYGLLLQEWIESRVGPYSLSLRSVAFGGRHVCLYANLAPRANSNHGLLAYVEAGDRWGLSSEPPLKAVSFDERSWEAKIWFGDDEPAYLRHNLYEEEVAVAPLVVPAGLLASIKDVSVRIERYYESLDFAALPPALFE